MLYNSIVPLSSSTDWPLQSHLLMTHQNIQSNFQIVLFSFPNPHQAASSSSSPVTPILSGSNVVLSLCRHHLTMYLCLNKNRNTGMRKLNCCVLPHYEPPGSCLHSIHPTSPYETIPTKVLSKGHLRQLSGTIDSICVESNPSNSLLFPFPPLSSCWS